MTSNSGGGSNFGAFGSESNGNGGSGVKEIASNTGFTQTTTESNPQKDEEVFKKYSNAKAISSDAFNSNKNVEKADMSRFHG
mmetsp:Transcript_24680/g.21852  ORF Transcript_24680/g.21852 Transcript_24680/m.21852 type:complete len:82 (-) Transcript_24680:323-568(-)